MKKELIRIAFTLSLIVMIAGCSSSTNSSSDDKGTITIGYNNFSETIAVVNVWKQILEDQGYDVDLTQTEKGPLFAALSQGDVDINAEVWLPSTDKSYVEDKIVQHEAWYEDTTIGLAVPEYVDIDSIANLNDHKEKFNGQIVGIDPGASIMKATEQLMDKYDLDYNVIESSDAAVTAELKKSYEAKEPIVVTLWEPHWAFARWNLKFLDDTKNVYGDPDKMYWFSREGFEADFPEVTKWFNQWYMSHEQLGDLMNVIEKNDNQAKKGAKQWLDNNQDLVDEWTKS